MDLKTWTGSPTSLMERWKDSAMMRIGNYTSSHRSRTCSKEFCSNGNGYKNVLDLQKKTKTKSRSTTNSWMNSNSYPACTKNTCQASWKPWTKLSPTDWWSVKTRTDILKKNSKK